MAEITVSFLVLLTGGGVAFTVMGSAVRAQEFGRERSTAFQATQDRMEVLLAMKYSDLLALHAATAPLTFPIASPEFPKAADGQSLTGTCKLTDVSTEYGWPAGSNKALEIDVRVDHGKIHARLVSRRASP